MAARQNAPEGDPLYEEGGRQMIFETSDIAASSNFVLDVIYPFEEVGQDLQNEYLEEQGLAPITHLCCSATGFVGGMKCIEAVVHFNKKHEVSRT